MNFQEILSKASSRLKLKNIKSYKLDSELLLAKTLNISREEVLLNLNYLSVSYPKLIFKRNNMHNKK